MFSVLHVEHNRFYHEIVKNVIADEELQYIPVKSPDEAYKILESTKINLIITGLIFEGQSGEHFIKSLNASKYKNLPVLILSSNEDEEIHKNTKEFGKIEFMNKNLPMDKLKACINKYISRDYTYQKLKEFKIAVLDDNEFELKIIKKFFDLNNVTNVSYYTDPEVFLNAKVNYSLNLIDYMLPKLSSEKVVADLRARDKGAIILVASSVENEGIISNILNSGANDYIIKPFNEDILLARLRINISNYILNK